MTNLCYKKGNWKYRVTTFVPIEINIFKAKEIITDFITIKDGILYIKNHYCWDGPSGPTIDTKTFMRGSLVHDALYQLMRMGELPQFYRKKADEELRRICIEDGMMKLRAWWVYRGVRIGGKWSAKASKKDNKNICVT